MKGVNNAKTETGSWNLIFVNYTLQIPTLLWWFGNYECKLTRKYKSKKPNHILSPLTLLPTQAILMDDFWCYELRISSLEKPCLNSELVFKYQQFFGRFFSATFVKCRVFHEWYKQLVKTAKIWLEIEYWYFWW